MSDEITPVTSADNTSRAAPPPNEHAHHHNDGHNVVDQATPRFGNPGPLGLLSFAATLFVVSMYSVQARHVQHSNAALGMAMGFGGLGLLIAGIEEWANRNTFGATAFVSYAGFWLSYSFFFIPSLGLAASFPTTAEFNSAVGLYLSAWGILTLIFLIAALRTSIALIATFATLDITFWCFVGGIISENVKVTKAGGAFGIVSSAIAAYIGLAGLLGREGDHAVFTLPVGDMSHRSMAKTSSVSRPSQMFRRYSKRSETSEA